MVICIHFVYVSLVGVTEYAVYLELTIEVNNDYVDFMFLDVLYIITLLLVDVVDILM